MGEQRPEYDIVGPLLKRQRWSGLWNGVVIGMGLGWLLWGSLIGILPLALGIGMEWMQRKRLRTSTEAGEAEDGEANEEEASEDEGKRD